MNQKEPRKIPMHQRSRLFAAMRLLALAFIALCLFTGTASAEGDTARVLYIPLDNLPEITKDEIQVIISRKAQLLSTAKYRSRARRKGLRYSSIRTIKRLGRRQNPDIFVVAGYSSVRRRRLRVTYRDGENAGKLEEIEFRISADGELSRKQKRRVNRNLNEAIAAYARRYGEDIETKSDGGIVWPKKNKADEGGEGQSTEEGGEETGEEGVDAEEGSDEENFEEEVAEEAKLPEHSPVYLSFRAGFGMGHRSIKLPTVGGNVRLKTAPFLAASVQLQAGFTLAGGKALIGAEADYESSIALSLSEQFADGTTRTVDARSSGARVGAFSNIRLGKKTDRSPFLHIGTGFGFRFFVTEQEISVPRNTLAGPYIRPGIFFPIGEGPLTVGVVPFGQVFFLVSQGIQDEAGVNAFGGALGAELQAEYFIKSWLRLGLFYSESHAFLGTEQGGKYRDAIRYVMLRLLYYM